MSISALGVLKAILRFRDFLEGHTDSVEVVRRTVAVYGAGRLGIKTSRRRRSAGETRCELPGVPASVAAQGGGRG